MARIYKESRYVLQLLIGKSYVAQYKDIKISFYTKNPNNQVMVDDGITIKRNIAEVKIESTLFDNLEEGLISYIVYGTKDGIPFIEERQSNYFLKTPLDFKPTTCILEDKSVTPSMGDRNVDGYIIVEEDEGYDGLSRVVIDPQTLYNEGINEQKSKLESISITENGTYTKEDGYNHIEVNVNIIPKINIQETGLRFGNSTFTEVPEWADFKGLTNTTRMFQNCFNLQTIPLLDTSNVVDMNYMFQNCSNLQTIPQIDTSNVINMSNMFFSCTNLQTIPAIDTSNVADMSSMFIYCDNLRTLPELDVSKVTNISAYFKVGVSNLTDVGGWKNLKINWNDNNGLARCPNLTYQSCINILNGLYDFVGNGSTETRTLKVHQNFLNTVGDEISIGTSKGWTITA